MKRKNVREPTYIKKLKKSKLYFPPVVEVVPKMKNFNKVINTEKHDETFDKSIMSLPTTSKNTTVTSTADIVKKVVANPRSKSPIVNVTLSRGFFTNARPIQPILQVLTAVIVESHTISVRLLLTDGEFSCDHFGFCKTLDERVIIDRLDHSANLPVIKLKDYHFSNSVDNFDVGIRIVLIKDYEMVANPKKLLSTSMKKIENYKPFFKTLREEMYENDMLP